MKRYLGFLLVLAMLFVNLGMLSLPVGALEANDTTSRLSREADLEDIGSVDACEYDPKTLEITLSGIVNHDITVENPKHMIHLYRIPFGKEASEILDDSSAQPLASSTISIRFEFVVDAKDVADRFSRYVSVLVSPEGEKQMIASPVYPSAPDWEEGEERDTFKGIATQRTTLALDGGAQTVIVPVYMEKLLNPNFVGYLYSSDGTNLHFDKEYINALDVKVRSYSATGAKVYLQFLLTASGSKGLSVYESGAAVPGGYLPNLHDADTRFHIASFADFLSNRYSNHEMGTIDGIILGRNADKNADLFAGKLSVWDFSEEYAYYMTLVASMARANLPSCEIVVPVSDVDAYSKNSTGEGERNCKAFLQAL